MMRTRLPASILLVGVALAAAACGDDDNESQARERAEQLVEAARSTDIAPDLSVDAVRSVYGDDAPQVCGVLEDDPVNITTWARAWRGAPDEHVDDLVAYDRLVVDIYCPDQAERLDEVLDDLHVDS